MTELDSEFGVGTIAMTKTRVYNRYRYSPITPLNDAVGLHAQLKYTYSTSTGVAKQAKFDLPTTAYGGLTLTGGQLEETDRGASNGIQKDGKYNRWIWANYQPIYYQYIIGGRYGYEYQWEPDHWAGQITDSNPNAPPGSSTPIGQKGFGQPAFNAGPGGSWPSKSSPTAFLLLVTTANGRKTHSGRTSPWEEG